MLIERLLLAFLATCDPPTEQPDKLPPDTPVEDGQHFCCESLGTGTGNGCVMIGKEHSSLCPKLLYCAGSYMKDDGKVTCLD
jgi:hypothetical protein